MKVFMKIKGVDDFGKQYYGKCYNGNTCHKYQHHYPKTHKGDVILYYYPKGDVNTDGKMRLGAYLVTDDQEHYEDREGYTYEAGLMKRLTGEQRDGGFSEWHESIQSTNPKIWKIVEDLVVNALNKYNPEMILP